MHLSFHLRLMAALVAGCCLVALGPVAQAADPPITLELATEPDFPATDARRWSEMLGEMGLASVRIRGGRDGDQPAILTRGSDDSPSYHVVGILTGDGKLILPKGRFTLSDRGAVSLWFDKLKAAGIEGVTVKPAAFGLLPSQLVTVHEALAGPVGFATTGQKPRDAAKKIADSLSLKFVSDVAGQRALATGEPIADELQGLSSGTALAAILRPLGLVLVPEKSGSEIRLRIADSRAAREHWPVGWPPEGNPRETLPELFKMLNVEITETPLSEALPAIGGRLKTPILLDHNSLARAEIDLATKVDFPQSNTYYLRVLDRILFQARLKVELRVDEAKKPLLWVSSVRR